jgi:hypothetical protein
LNLRKIKLKAMANLRLAPWSVTTSVITDCIEASPLPVGTAI